MSDAQPEAAELAAAAPRRGDKPPKAKAKGKRGGRRPGAGRPPGSPNKPKDTPTGGTTKMPAGAALQAQDRALIAGLATVLTLPAVPAVMFTPSDEGKAFIGQHFVTVGPTTAMQLVELSHQSPELRDILMKLTEGGLWTGLATLAVCYIGPPVLWSIGKRTGAQALEAFATMDPTEMAEAMMAAQSTMPTDAGTPSPEAQREAADAARAATRPPEPGADPAQQQP